MEGLGEEIRGANVYKMRGGEREMKKRKGKREIATAKAREGNREIAKGRRAGTQAGRQAARSNNMKGSANKGKRRLRRTKERRGVT